MFIKSYDVLRIDTNKGIVVVMLENGEEAEYPYQLIGVKNAKIKPSEITAMIIGEDRVNAVAIIFPKHGLISQQKG